MRKHTSFHLLIVCILLVYSTIPGCLPKSDGEIDCYGIYDLGYTYQSADGNRYQEGNIDLETAKSKIFRLERKPLWVVGLPLGDANLWAVVLDNGDVKGFLYDGDLMPVEVIPHKLFAGSPPVLDIIDGKPVLLNTTKNDESEFSHPVKLSDGKIAYITPEGNMNVISTNGIDEYIIDVLPDGRILKDENDRLLVLTGRTTKYPHGILGDNIEAMKATIIDANCGGSISIRVPDDKVIEAIAPIWVDLDFDGIREVILTLSDTVSGARLAVYSENGILLAESPPVGRGSRWRHLTAVAPFGPGGEIEIVDTLTPHIVGEVEFFQMNGNELELTATISGYSSHKIGSRNLDMAIAADFNLDGKAELLIPTDSMDTLGLISRTSEGAEEIFRIELESNLSTNLSGITMHNGKLQIAFGLENGYLLIFSD